MKKYFWIVLLFVALIIGGFIYFYNSNFNKNFNYTAKKSSLNNTTSDTIPKNSNLTSNTSSDQSGLSTEYEISSFSTKIQNKKDKNRQGNITITCSALNNTIVKKGEVFSFCDIVGESTVQKGYKEANVIIQGVETKGLGRWKLSS